MVTKQETIGEIIRSAPEAQRLIGKMVLTKSENITPCNECAYATNKGCSKELFKPSGDGSREIGPFFEPDKKAVICPIQKGVIFVSNGNGHASK